MTIEAAFPRFPTLTTERLVLRQIQPTDAAAFFEVLSDANVVRYTSGEPHQSIEQTRELIRRLQAAYDKRESMRWAITLRGEERMIGSCCLWHFDEGFHRAEIGYELHPAFWGQGIASEAVSALLSYSFTELALHRIEADVDPENEASKRLLLKLGFTYEGTLRQRYFLQGSMVDESYFGLLRDEWLGMQKAERNGEIGPTNP